jgi:subtilase family serine protease
MSLTVAAVQAAGLADLVPSRIGVKLSPQGGGCEADIQATIRNIGVVDTGGYVIRFTVDGTRIFDAPAPNGTNAGGRSTESVVVPVAVGTHTVVVVADTNNQVPESNETNNSLSDAFVCR